MTIGGIGGIGGGRGSTIATGSTAGSPDDGPHKTGEEKKPLESGDVLEISTPEKQISDLEQLTHDALAEVSPETLNFIAAEHAVMIDPVLQQRVADIRRKLTIAAGARAYKIGLSAYPLPVQPVEPITPVNPDTDPQQDIIERDEEKDANEKNPNEEN